MKQTTLTTQTFIKRLSLLLMLLLGGWGLTPTAQAQAVEYLVPCSVDRNLHLLEKILAANTNPGLVTLILAEGCTYTLLGPYNGVNNGLPIITDDLIIEGNGATIERSGATTREFRLVEIGPGVEVTLKNMTLKNGYAPDYNNGGAIYADGSTKLTIDDVRFIENKAFSGGAVYTKGTMTVRRSKFDQNQASSAMAEGSLRSTQLP